MARPDCGFRASGWRRRDDEEAMGRAGEFISSDRVHFLKVKSAESAAALSVGHSGFEALAITLDRRTTP